MTTPSARSLQVEVGGTSGYADLDSAANFTDGLSTGREDVYTHANGTIAEGVGGIDAKVGKAWASAGPGTAEFGVFPSNFFPQSYADIWVANGLAVADANVNVDNTSPTFLKDFERFVDEGRTIGHVQNFAPVFSPNSTSEYNGSQASLGTGFFDAKWASVRAAAIYGGGIAFDTPPQFAFWSPPWYMNFVEQEIRWGESMGLRTSVIVSPYLDATTFLADSQKFEQMLVNAHAAPTQWVIENYDVNPNGTYPNDSTDSNAIGSEKTPETVAAVADWFARNAPTAVLGAAAGSYRIQNADGSFGDTYSGSSNGRTLVDASAVGKTVYTYAAGGAQTAAVTTLAPPVRHEPDRRAERRRRRRRASERRRRLRRPERRGADPDGAPGRPDPSAEVALLQRRDRRVHRHAAERQGQPQRPGGRDGPRRTHRRRDVRPRRRARARRRDARPVRPSSRRPRRRRPPPSRRSRTSPWAKTRRSRSRSTRSRRRRTSCASRARPASPRSRHGSASTPRPRRSPAWRPPRTAASPSASTRRRPPAG